VQRLAAATLPAIPQVALPDLAGVLGGEVLALPAPAAAPTFAAAPTGDRPRPFAAFSASASGLLDRVTSRARGQLGTRYVLGGERPGAALDCSSFARYVMAAVGLRLPRTAQQQAQVGRAVPRDRAALRPGDLLTFGTRRHVDHVGIYLGQGRFIHASVSSGRVIETTIERNGSLFRKWTGARRLIAGADSMRDDG
jgi:cell wall-associated NlpC family hydrolase